MTGIITECSVYIYIYIYICIYIIIYIYIYIGRLGPALERPGGRPGGGRGRPGGGRGRPGRPGQPGAATKPKSVKSMILAGTVRYFGENTIKTKNSHTKLRSGQKSSRRRSGRPRILLLRNVISCEAVRTKSGAKYFCSPGSSEV